jgi:hypothetical protein
MSFAKATSGGAGPLRHLSCVEYGSRRGGPQGVPSSYFDSLAAVFAQNLPHWRTNHYILTIKARMDRDPDMNAPSELNSEEMLRIRLGVLIREHRDLDDAIHALQESARADALTLRRLKKQKLALKDRIVKIEDQLIPDIIA